MNIDLSDQTKIPKSKKEFLHELCDASDLHNLISEPTCITKTRESMIDLILTNCSRSFMHSKAIESGLSDFHKMTVTTMKCIYTRQEPVKITYRDYTEFNTEKFIKDFESQSHNLQKDNLDQLTSTAYNNLITTLKNILAVHAPIKHGLIRGHQAPFINKNLSRAVTHRSKLRNKYNKSKSTFD